MKTRATYTKCGVVQRAAWAFIDSWKDPFRESPCWEPQLKPSCIFTFDVSVCRHAVTEQLHVSLNGFHLGSPWVQTCTISSYAFTSWITRGRSCQERNKQMLSKLVFTQNKVLRAWRMHSPKAPPIILLNGCQRSGDIVFLWRHSGRAVRTATWSLLRQMGMFMFRGGGGGLLSSFPREKVTCQVSHVHSRKIHACGGSWRGNEKVGFTQTLPVPPNNGADRSFVCSGLWLYTRTTAIYTFYTATYKQLKFNRNYFSTAG